MRSAGWRIAFFVTGYQIPVARPLIPGMPANTQPVVDLCTRKPEIGNR